MTDILKLDSRGRVNIKKSINKNGIAAALAFAVTFGPNQTLILSPLGLTAAVTPTPTPIPTVTEQS